jgi:hypothetical protein
VARLNQRLQEAAGRYEVMQAELRRIRTHSGKIAILLQERDNELRMLKGSLSWRAGAPLRRMGAKAPWFSHSVRRVFKGGRSVDSR